MHKYLCFDVLILCYHFRLNISLCGVHNCEAIKLRESITKLKKLRFSQDVKIVAPIYCPAVVLFELIGR